MTTPQQIDRAKRAHGFWLERGPGGLWFLFVPVGTDPADGSPLSMVRRASADESTLWLEGKMDDLAASLRCQGVPVQQPGRRGAWQRFVHRVRKAMGL